MVKSSPSLEDKFDLGETHQILNGSQAIVRLMLMQQRARPAGGPQHGRLLSRAIAARRSPVSKAAMIRVAVTS